VSLTLAQIAQLEQDWVGRVQVDQPDVYFDWQPFPADRFTALLEGCLPAVPAGSRSFLDAGCGIGTKQLIAAGYGLSTYGIDRVPEYLEQAHQLGVSAELADARDYTGYGGYGVVYVNHPLRCDPGCDDEAVLEARIHELMAPGAVLIAVNYDLAPGCPVHASPAPCTDGCPPDSSSWPQVAHPRRWDAIWVKPGG
jgi:trans-aconitate methyltransferase